MIVPGVDGGGFGCPEDNVFLSFDDLSTNTAAQLETSCGGMPPAISGTFQPVGSLLDFAGVPLVGAWTLTVIDNADQDGGVLNGWGLDICSTVPDDASLNISTAELEAWCRSIG